MYPDIQKRYRREPDTGVMGRRDLHCGLDGSIGYCIHDRTGQLSPAARTIHRGVGLFAVNAYPMEGVPPFS